MLAGAAVFLLGRKEGVRMLKQSSKTVNKFWKEMSKSSGAKDAEVVKKTATTKATKKKD